ncbi:MAG: hypothetical protein AAF216_07825 [Pseudomonadota bacterium]
MTRQIGPIALVSLGSLALVSLAACTDAAPASDPDVSIEAPAETDVSAEAGTLDAAVAGAWRSDADTARDGARNPAETLAFFGVESSDTVVELWPGGGWYSQVLAPYLASGSGQLVAATWARDEFGPEYAEQLDTAIEAYRAGFAAQPELYGTVVLTTLSAESGPMVDAGTADVVLTFRNIHNWMDKGYLDKVFADAFAALKPGGTFGVVEHRLPSRAEQDPSASSGYVHEDFVKAVAARAGFEFAEASEINANPVDNADHPFGVWTLPPNLRSTGPDGETPENYDASVFEQIGESDRMTLKFVKPVPSQ